MPYKTIDIAKHYNHKLIYDFKPKEGASCGLDNIYVSKYDFLSEGKALGKGIEYTYNLGEHDNVICNGQRIFIGSKVKRWHFVGFAYWGNVNEIVKIIYDDNTEDWIKITFIDWFYLFDHNIWNENVTQGNKIENIRTVVTSGDIIHLIYFHDCICEFHGEKNVKEIILPNNILVHIFAITIEN